MAEFGRTVKTTCPYCGVGCGIVATPQPGGSVDIKGDVDHPANFGRLCSKGAALSETLVDDNRLLMPAIGGNDTSWDRALSHVANSFKTVISDHGPDAVAFYVSGQLMTEAYYVANKLMKGFMGSANIDTNSRLCMSSTVAAQKRCFGSDLVPTCYDDLEQADLVVIVGSNMAWCHPVLYQRLVAARQNNGTRVVVIDPRKTATCDIADVHLAIKPGTDVKLFNGLFVHLVNTGQIDQRFTENHTSGFEETFIAALQDGAEIAGVAAVCGLDEQQLIKFYQLFEQRAKTVTVFSQGVNQSSSGTDKVNAILNVHLMTGRIGKPGQGPLSLTGQPNAMGGREVGGLANVLAAHMDFGVASMDRVGRFWQAQNMARKPGLKAVDLFSAVNSGQIKALWVMGTNPAVSMPESSVVKSALEKCPFVVVSDCSRNVDTLKYANVVFPATTWGERDGIVTNSERMMSRQRSFKKPPGSARADWRIICDVAKKMGFNDAFDYSGPAQIFNEHARLSAFENDGSRVFNLSGLTNLSAAGYDHFPPVKWPALKNADAPSERLFADGRFDTDDTRACFVPLSFQPPLSFADKNFPLLLNTGRVRDQWHTMTRTGESPKLARHRAEPFIEINSDDAKQYGLVAGQLAVVSSQRGDIIVRAGIDEGCQQGTVFVPIHWSDQNASNAVVSKLISPGRDAVSGQPEFKNTAVAVAPFNAAWSGLVVTKSYIDGPDVDYWTRMQARGCSVMTMSGLTAPDDWQVFIDKMAGQHDFEWVSYSDSVKSIHRFAGFLSGQLQMIVFISPHPNLPDLTWIEEQFSDQDTKKTTRLAVLAGRSSGPVIDPGALVCSCFGVGLNQLIKAIVENGAMTVETIGDLIKAGTNCGSCRPEIQAILEKQRAA